MQRNIRPNVLKTPQGIRSESIQRAQEILRTFAEDLQTHGSVNRAAAKAATQNKAALQKAEKKTK